MGNVIDGGFWRASTFDGHMVDIYRTLTSRELYIVDFAERYLGCREVSKLHEIMDNIAMEYVDVGNKVAVQVVALCTLSGFDCYEDEAILPHSPELGPINIAIHKIEDVMYPAERYFEVGIVQRQAFTVRRRRDKAIVGHVIATFGAKHRKISVHRRGGRVGVCGPIQSNEPCKVSLSMCESNDTRWINLSPNLLNVRDNIDFSAGTVRKIVNVLDSWK